MTGAPTCQWCGTPMSPARQPKKYCSSAHRGAFHEAARRLGERLFDEGAVTIEQLRGETTSNTAEQPLTATGAPEASPDQGDDHHE